MNRTVTLAKTKSARRRASRRKIIDSSIKHPLADMTEVAPSPVLALPSAKDKTLFTPGPLTTSLSVKQAMLRDAGSWHYEFNVIVKSVRERLLALAGFTAGSGGG